MRQKRRITGALLRRSTRDKKESSERPLDKFSFDRETVRKRELVPPRLEQLRRKKTGRQEDALVLRANGKKGVL